MSDVKTVRVEIEFEDGKIISLHGDDAQKWQELVNGMSVVHFVHGGAQPELPWKETRREKADGAAH
jgi:hypothetical protein